MTNNNQIFGKMIHEIDDLLAQHDCKKSINEVGQEVICKVKLQNGFCYTITRTLERTVSTNYLSASRDRTTLSPREKEIIRLVCAGMPNKAISDILEISQWTVATYLKRIFAKFSVGTRAEMVAYALQHHLIE